MVGKGRDRLEHTVLYCRWANMAETELMLSALWNSVLLGFFLNHILTLRAHWTLGGCVLCILLKRKKNPEIFKLLYVWLLY